ncbi:MAG: ABC transporter permease [Mycolicibacterium rufum]|jgi:ABC-2 type transport system permease protein|uniref:Transport permease protein n=1 Tax=Mycolicibacterium chubuense TaxID=1800 RepID=A0A0J6WKI6_MYCCU|nr:ABC transporter permease [Mycolicibacterium chubuense]KMO83134.1 Daunorubicin/doxorubicin resistance ABC transporter permease protein DrrB [Mycolicibacterium chubuense]MBI5336249.1 ABC transporter permease [Mycolicibacterium rufum]ORA46066.1 peptide ABC transporter permease [Mycolicibacterium chubuense]SPX96022.1 ABC transporter efflux protein, DrrB family [Mycolicibacterium chubuense]
MTATQASRAEAPYRPGGRHRVARVWENSPRRLVPQVLVLTARILRRWSRDPATLVQSLVMPAGFLAALDIVLGDVIEKVTGHSGLYGQVPLVALVGGMTGAIIGAVNVMREREVGLLSRFWVVPVHRAAGLLARLLADFVRILVITLAVMCVGLALGMRFEQGLLAAVVWVFVPSLFVVALSAAVLTLALFSQSTIVPQATEIVIALLMFFSIGFVPLDQYPDWLQPIVEHQPVSYTIEAMRGLSLEGPIAEPLLFTALWSFGIFAVCAVPLAIGYRKASRRG